MLIFLCTLLLHAAINDDLSSFWHKRIPARTWKRDSLTLFVLCLVLFQLYFFHARSPLCLHPVNVVPDVLLVLNHNKNISISRDSRTCTGLRLLSVFISSTAHSSLLLTPSPPSVMCFRLFLKSHSGTAGRQSSLVINGADFSTKDMDNDNCMCKCALMLTGGECSQTRRC